ncbi:DUF423 domain-containing protein [SAR92 clade bacterium H231]|mgnify:FL=1|jgi:uncharacterized membrane protein YgdD (TMEM256/DUF423 family)|nr:DUF423 domain-containing protein [Porticoccaceae bacterium]MCT2533048.1 DUF423 domain-containing protein [SAR92 clade bacterium H231]MBT6320282.1 DUF423 domain-containing protein [Porticoccaceae bacterium]MBT7257573.1 DUF423 domain-containing protein [Porticoccaceae bacterium]MBT7905821.1 DUF423 domain-containing protein [Porticoccaceae bacterium]
MNKSLWIKIIALSGAISVALGAFAAHGLADSLSVKALATFRTAVLYQFLHTIALLGLMSLPDQLMDTGRQQLAAKSWLLGILLFSGSLYTLVFTGITALGMITPVGGLAFIVGWLLLFTGVKRSD